MDEEREEIRIKTVLLKFIKERFRFHENPQQNAEQLYLVTDELYNIVIDLSVKK